MKKLVSFTIMALLLVSAAASLNAVSAQGYQVKKIWSLPMATNDEALSKDGNYVAAVNNTGLYYFHENSSAPTWWYLTNATANEMFLSVAISANGEYVIVGNNTYPTTGPYKDSIYYFGNSTKRSGQQLSNSYNWTSQHFLGNGWNVDRGTIDISANGQYVVVGGTGDNVYYFGNSTSGCTTKSGANQLWSWIGGVNYGVTTIDLSPDGNFIAVGGPGYNPSGFVAFYVNATNAQHVQKWQNYSLDGIWDVEVSDDGYAVAAVSVGLDTLYYWANAASLSGSPAATWTRNHDFTSVDMSSDGNRVVAGYEELDITSLHYWDNAKTRTGTDEKETWIALPTLQVRDVAISNSGSIIVATTYNYTSGQAEVYFFTSDDTFIAKFPLMSQDDHILSMSGDGQTVAVGGGAFDSLSLYSLEGIAPISVGGYDVAPNYLVVLLGLAAPWIIAAAIASTVAIAVILKKARRHGDAAEA